MNERLIHKNEKVYFITSLVISIITYLLLIASLIGIVYILIGLIITFFLHGIMVAHFRSNGVKLTEQQFPEIHEKVLDLCRRMGIQKIPAVYVIQSGGLLNAFATRFFGRNFVVLYSDIFELVESGNQAEVTFIIAHELAHIRRQHITKQLLILPALWVPFLGTAYSRACEYTCDLIATAYTGNEKAAVNALTILAIGRNLFKRVNIADYLLNYSKETGFFIWFCHILSTHPPLPKRIKEINYFSTYPQLYGYQSSGFEVTEISA